MAGAKGIRAGKAFVEIGGDDLRLQRVLRRAQARLRAFGAGVRTMGLRMTAIGGAILAPLGAATKHFISAGDQLEKMAIRTGISVEALSELGYAAGQSSSDILTLEKGVRTMQRSINDLGRGLSTQVDAFSDLGLTMDDLKGLSPEEQFKLIADRLSQIEDPTKRAALAMMILGQAGTQLLPLMQGGAAGIEDLQKQARALGLTMSTKDAQAAAILGDRLDDLWATVRMGVFLVGSALAQKLTEMVKRVTRVSVSIGEWIKQNKAVVLTVAKIGAAVLAAGLALLLVSGMITTASFVFGALATAVGAVATVFSVIATVIGAVLSPIGLLVSAVVGLGAAWLHTSGVAGVALDWLARNFGQLRTFVGQVMGGIRDALAAGDIQLAAEVLWAGLTVIWQKGATTLASIWLQVKNFFVSIWSRAVFATAKLSVQAWGGLQRAWIETTDFLADAWSVFTTFITKSWHTAIGFIKKAWVRLKALFDSDINVEAEVKAIDDDVQSKIDATNQERDAAIVDRMSRRRDQVQSLEKEQQAILDALRQDESREDKARREQLETDLAQSQDALQRARERLAEAVAEARERREGIEGLPAGPSLRDRLSEFDFDGIAETVAQKLNVRGTFSAAAVRGLLSPFDPEERTAKATERTAKLLEQIARDRGMAFT